MTGKLDRQICYVTSSSEDPVLQLRDDRLITFCIGYGAARTSFFHTLKADVMVMTMPDLQSFHIKRSRYPVHYVYVHHALVSTHMSYRAAAFDHFDTVLCVGPHHIVEIRAREALYGLDPKVLVEHGYGRLDSLIGSASTLEEAEGLRRGKGTRVLIAPSWGKDALLETCGIQLVEILLDGGYDVTVRPHGMTTRNNPGLIKTLRRRFGSNPKVNFDLNIASQASLHASDIMICDWGGVGLEYAFSLERPVIFVDLPRKVTNPEYEKIPSEPLEVALRSQIGTVVRPDALGNIPALIEDALNRDSDAFKERVRQLRTHWVYNVGSSGTVGAEYIVQVADGAKSTGTA